MSSRMEFSIEDLSPYFHTLVYNIVIKLTAKVSDALVYKKEKNLLCHAARNGELCF
jgi:hypothetical protein